VAAAIEALSGKEIGEVGVAHFAEDLDDSGGHFRKRGGHGGRLRVGEGIGKRLLPPMDDRFSARRGTYRIIYRIDDKNRIVTVVDVDHRDAYRT